jgi:(R,R)-butanediol dehydrogenase/meso-butanediol dehydrogenase/diacetyl reductase
MLPTIMGHEYCARVVETGRQVTTVRPGDRVAVMPHHYCGSCAHCLRGRQQNCPGRMSAGFSWPWGGLAEYSVMGEAQVSPLPDGMSESAGALVEPAAVALHAAASAPVRAGDTVLVAGGGPIGQLAGLAARALGAGRVVVSETNRARRDRAALLGFTVTDPSADDVPALLAGLTGGTGADVALECSGVQAGLDACLGAVGFGGTVVQTALTTSPSRIDTAAALTRRDVTLRGVFCYPFTSWPRVIGLIGSGQLPAEQVLTGTVPLDDLVTGGFGALTAPGSDQVKITIKIG